MREETRQLNLKQIFSDAAGYLESHQRELRWFWLANLALLTGFRFLDGGFSNPLSIGWLAVYYIYWCGFFRVYYQKKPYFLSTSIFGSIVPSTKMVFLTLLAAFALVLLPYIPLLMGFNDRYLTFFEKYMEALQNMEADLLNQLILSFILILLSPQLICRPFFAWIAALQGYNGSLRKAFRKTAGNYGKFVLAMLLLNMPCVVILELDQYMDCHGWLAVVFYSIFFIYLNLVFAKMYDFFYNE